MTPLKTIYLELVWNSSCDSHSHYIHTKNIPEKREREIVNQKKEETSEENSNQYYFQTLIIRKPQTNRSNHDEGQTCGARCGTYFQLAISNGIVRD